MTRGHVDASAQVYHEAPLRSEGGAIFVLHCPQDEGLCVLAEQRRFSGQEREQQVRILGVWAIGCSPAWGWDSAVGLFQEMIENAVDLFLIHCCSDAPLEVEMACTRVWPGVSCSTFPRTCWSRTCMRHNRRQLRYLCCNDSPSYSFPCCPRVHPATPPLVSSRPRPLCRWATSNISKSGGDTVGVGTSSAHGKAEERAGGKEWKQAEVAADATVASATASQSAESRNTPGEGRGVGTSVEEGVAGDAYQDTTMAVDAPLELLPVLLPQAGARASSMASPLSPFPFPPSRPSSPVRFSPCPNTRVLSSSCFSPPPKPSSAAGEAGVVKFLWFLGLFDGDRRAKLVDSHRLVSPPFPNKAMQ